jgi:hypothetical protein
MSDLTPEKETAKILPSAGRKVGDGTPGPGRKKGIPNKTTTQIKEAVIAALEQVGGVEYLAQQARLNPTAFMALLGRIIPVQVTGEGGGAIQVTISRGDADL